MNLSKRLFYFFRSELLLTVSAFCALLSMIAAKPSLNYLSYIDFQTLGLLFCLMGAIQGLTHVHVFEVIAKRILLHCKTTRSLFLILIGLTFFIAMLVTNDVALITLVPFTIYLLKMANAQRKLPLIIVLQTVAANLGSMATPIGNPQNLYLYSFYDLSIGQFFLTVLPTTLVSLVGLILIVFLLKNDPLSVSFEATEKIGKYPFVALYSGLFILCLCSVLGGLDYRLLLLFVLLFLFIFSPAVIKQVDYSLLLTFVCFFIFSGNIGQIPIVKQILSSFLGEYTLLTSAVASQLISNVPAAVLLSGFTQNWHSLLLGVNIGGLGTPIASLASVIAIKIYFHDPSADKRSFWKWFILVNGSFLICLTLLSFVIR